MSDTEEGIQARLADFLGLKDEMLPKIRILDPANGMRKYSYSGDAKRITVDSLATFISEFKAGKLSPYFKS